MDPTDPTPTYRPSIYHVLVQHHVIAHCRVRERHESEPARVPGRPVLHDHRVDDLAILLEVALQIVCTNHGMRAHSATTLTTHTKALT
jgi:hypothetical protein